MLLKRKFIYYHSFQCIDYDFKGLQDPTYYVLLAFSQNNEATMDKMLLSLQKIDRIDVINRSLECFNSFFQKISQNYGKLLNYIFITNLFIQNKHDHVLIDNFFLHS